MKRFILLVITALSALPVFAQTIPGAPAYQLPVTVTAQKWYGTAAPTSALNYPVQPGDFYFDTTNKNEYWCAAPVTSTITPFTAANPACSSVTSGGWTLVAGSSGTVPSSGLNPNTIQFVSVPLSLTQLTTMFTTPVQIVAAPGAGNLIEVQSCVLNLTYGSAAFTGGGAVSIGYGSTEATVAASIAVTNIAASVFTTFTASHSIQTSGAMPVTADTLNANQPLSITNAGAVFAAGTGATGQVDCAYRIHTGIQ